MTWQDVGKIASKFAPLVGTALAGPLGTGIGTIIAAEFGVDPVPDKVAQAIQADPQAALKLGEIESNNKLELQKALIAAQVAQMQEETKQQQAVNQTMQVEAQSQKWYVAGWRPYWGFVSGTAFLVVCTFVCYLGYRAVIVKDFSCLSVLPTLIGAFSALFAIPGAILGVTAWHRGKMQRAQAGEQPQPGILSSIAQRIAGTAEAAK